MSFNGLTRTKKIHTIRNNCTSQTSKRSTVLPKFVARDRNISMVNFQAVDKIQNLNGYYKIDISTSRQIKRDDLSTSERTHLESKNNHFGLGDKYIYIKNEF